MKLKILVVDDEPDLEPLILQRFRRQIRAAKCSSYLRTTAMKR